MTISHEMTPHELRAALEALDIGQVDLGRILGTNDRSPQRWVKDGGAVPGCVAFVVRLLLARPELKAVAGIERHSRAGRPPRKGRA